MDFLLFFYTEFLLGGDVGKDEGDFQAGDEAEDDEDDEEEEEEEGTDEPGPSKKQKL